ncbi:MAG: acyl-CoA dehydrogenase family protein [Chloroflexi bacterium]|nr:acyl-CoA dehydrogenase family protein [Chloroflexota bacterium]
MVLTTEALRLGGFDFFKLEDRLNDEQRALRDQIRDFVHNEVHPKINPYWEKAEFPWEIAEAMKTLPIWGGGIKGYGCAGLDTLSAGLVAFEIAKGDGSIGTFYGVHSGLAMGSIGRLGSEEQKQRWLPSMAKLEKIGAFGLTEPEHGSDAVGLETTAHRDGDSYILNGAKRWIGNASIADILIIWARDDDGALGGFIIENPNETEGVTIENIWGKISKRAVLNADITLENVKVPVENRLEKVRSFRDIALVLEFGRYGVGWEAAGVATALYEFAREYALQRHQFGKPIASFQLIQQKIVEMATEVSLMQLMCYRAAELLSEGYITPGLVSMMKYNNAKKGRYVAQLARETLGGNGILIENHIARLMLDAEVIYTYEGTNEVNMLILGRELTGINAIMG